MGAIYDALQLRFYRSAVREIAEWAGAEEGVTGFSIRTNGVSAHLEVRLDLGDLHDQTSLPLMEVYGDASGAVVADYLEHLGRRTRRIRDRCREL